MQFWKRFMSMMLVGVMVFVMLPAGVIAEEMIPEIDEIIEVEELDVPMAESAAEIGATELEQLVEVEVLDAPVEEPTIEPAAPEASVEPEVTMDPSLQENLQDAEDIIEEIPEAPVESEALVIVKDMLDALLGKYYIVDEAGNVTASAADFAASMDAEALELCNSELDAFAEAAATLTAEDQAALAGTYAVQLAYIAELQAEVAALMPTALDNVLAQMEALKTKYYREFEGELWVLFETLVAVEDVNVLLAVYEETYAAMGAYAQLTEADKAVVDAQYADVIDFMTQYVAAIEAKMSTPAMMAAGSSRFDTSATNGYYNILSEKDYNIISGVTETEIVMNNVEGSRRQVFRFFSINPKSPSIELVPGYYEIDKYASDPTNKAYQNAAKVTDMAAYYESALGYDIIGGMNTALAYDSNAPYSFLMWEGKVLQDKNDSFGLGYDWLNQHSGSCSTYLAIKKNGDVELRGGGDPFEADDWNCVGANFGWLVNDYKLATSTVERTTAAASRSMIGIKEDGTLILCQTDGRDGTISVGQSNYEMGELMLALGCRYAFNCDGGGSSTFISQRAGESGLTMRSKPSDGSERPTIHAIFIAKAKGMTPGIFDTAEINSEYDYFAPKTTYTFGVEAIDTTGAVMEMPEGGVWSLSDDEFGTITDGTFVSNGTLGEVQVQFTVGGKTFEYPITVVNPDSFGFDADGTVIPYGKSVVLMPTVLYGADNWEVYYQPDTFEWKFSDETVGTWDADTLTYTATADESKKGPTLTVTYKHSDALPVVTYKLDFGKGSELVAGWDFENGDVSDWMGFSDAKQWSLENGVNNTLVGSDPLAGQFSSENDAHTFLATASNGQVKNGKYALGITFDNSAADFRNWTYNVLFNVGETRVFRDVANGKNATTLGFWLYIPEGGAGLAFQSQFNISPDHTKPSCKQDHFMFTTVSGVRKNLNSCTEEDIPANRWVYASINISGYDYLSTMPATDETNSRSPSFLRTYVKPDAPAKLTFYIDDITLDYSSAVEDRNAPIISNAKYTTADEGVALTDGVEIIGNSMSFTAEIAESTESGEISGLNMSSAKIYIDGNEVETDTTRTAMATKTNVELADGQHRVTFEIEDNWYNRTQLSYEFTVKGEQVALAELSGHNDFGTVPEADSVYYVDINTAAAEDVAVIEATIQLNTANKWELDHMIVAPGFEVEFSRLDDERYAVATFARSTDIHSVENAVAVTLTRKDNCKLTGEQTLLSIPVRVWSWEGYNNVTDQPATAPDNKPTVNIDYTILFGYAENVAGEIFEFGGSKSVATTMTGATVPDGYTYHTHITTALVDKPATCTEDGYTGRTYCGDVNAVFTEHVECANCTGSGKINTGTDEEPEIVDCEACGGDGKIMCASNSCAVCNVGCGSVLEWGEAVAAVGHNYVRIGAGTDEDRIACEVCSERLMSSGLVQVGEDWYYLIAGNLVNGWHEVDGAWHYFRSSTKKAAQGTVRHQFGNVFLDYTYENGRLLDGVWVEVDGGMRYYYGPKCYSMTWADIDGARYYFGQDYARYEGYNIIKDSRYSHDDDYRMYLFGDDGKLIETLTSDGILVTENGTYYLEGGYARHKGLVLDNGDYYYFNSSRMAVTGEYYVEITNDLLPAGFYTFGEDGKMVKKNGIDGDYYYIDGIIQMTGLTKIGEDYYYFSTTNGIMSRNVTKMVYRIDSGCDLPVGEYTFGEDGKVILPELDGIVGDYYYIDGVMQMNGLTKVGEDYYYFSTTNGKMSRNITRMVYYVDANCDLPIGEYTFGADGKVIFPELDGIVGDYYYIDGVMQMTGLTKIGEDYYYFSTTNGVMSRNVTKMVYRIDSSCDLPVGEYTFGEDGKVILPELEGIVGDYYYIDGVMQMNGLTKVGEDYYYFSTTNGKMSRNVTRMVYYIDTYCDLPVGEYTFGADGKVDLTQMNGIIGDYYYANGVIQMTGLTKIGEDYYYFSTTNGVMSRNVTKMVYRIDSGCDLPVGEYTFGPDGKVVLTDVNGIVGDYYYIDGVMQMTGLTKIGEDYYYFSTTNGIMSRNVTKMVYRIDPNCDLPQGTYTFGADGKVVF